MERGYEESENIQGQAGDLSMPTVLPIRRQQVGPASSLRSQPIEIGTEIFRVGNLVSGPRRRNDMRQERRKTAGTAFSPSSMFAEDVKRKRKKK